MKNLLSLLLIILSTNLYSQNGKTANKQIDDKHYYPEKIEVVFPEKKSEKSTSDLLREWILAISGAASLITVSIGIWKSLAEYRLKIKAENRITESSRTESDIKLIKHFTEIMDIAHARSGYVVSETIIEKLFEKNIITTADFQNLEILNQKMEDAAILTYPVGVAAQDAAIASIAELAIRHEVLRKPALQALETIKEFKTELADKYIKEINKTINSDSKQ
jgi:hypothetical protein